MGVPLEKIKNGGGKILETALVTHWRDEILLCPVAEYRNAHAYIAPMLISRNLSLNIGNFFCNKTNNTYVYQFLMNELFRENYSVIFFSFSFRIKAFLFLGDPV